ncbi:Conodipine-P3 [Acropora cervicornis]|uniref:Conodipine-P3 n=1 Tax=Acropora cervicornis TaxID=6130 RepID=A0AAD9QD78_ACRCE|nr:Conodipine-P3 [Acropora cervicornis]
MNYSKKSVELFGFTGSKETQKHQLSDRFIMRLTIIIALIGLTVVSSCRVEYNGCSVPRHLPKPWINTMTPSCNKHDVCYYCGAYYGWRRKACDKAFKRDMRRACNRISSWWVRSDCKRATWYYYRGVRLFGRCHYENPSPAWCKKSCTIRHGSPYRVLGRK